MKKYIFTSVLLLLITLNFNAQTSSISGFVKSSDSVNAISGVNVYLDRTNYGAATNANGFYKIDNVPEGKHTLIVSNIGYKTIKKEINIKNGETLSLDFNISENTSTLQEMVFLSKRNQGLQDVPGSVQYISPKELEKYSFTDANRVLRNIPGVNIQEEDGFGLRPNIGLRGTGVERNSKITVMEDGILMAPAPYAAPAAYYFPTIGRMQGVEVSKGSSQIKNGPYTTGGAINFISTDIPNDFSGKISLLGGSFGGRNLHAFVGNSHKNVAYMVETFQYSSDGFKQLDNGGNTGFDKKDYLAKFRVNTNQDAKIYQSLTFKIGQANEVSNETYLGLTENDYAQNPFRRYAASQEDVITTSQTQFSATHFAKFTKNISLATTVYHTEFARNWYKLDKIEDSTGTKNSIANVLNNPENYHDSYEIMTGKNDANYGALTVKANNRKYYSRGVQTALHSLFKTGEFSHHIDLGLRIHEDAADRFQWEDKYAMVGGNLQLRTNGIPGTESNRIDNASAIASYIQYQLKYKNFSFTPGLRYENITMARIDYGKNDVNRTGENLNERSNQVGVFIPGAGLDYKFNPYMSAFAGVHKGFSPPSSQVGSQAEESINIEVGYRYTKNALSGQLVVYRNDYSNLLGSDFAAGGGAGTGEQFNAGQVLAQGVEFMISYDVLSKKEKSKFNLPISFNYTYTDAIFQTSFESTFGDWGAVTEGDQFPYLANNQFTASISLEHKKFSVNLSTRYMDAMRTMPGEGAIEDKEKTDSYLVLDASANYRLHNNISLFTNALNITNQTYVVAQRPAGLRPGMPRVFNLGLKANF